MHVQEERYRIQSAHVVCILLYNRGTNRVTHGHNVCHVQPLLGDSLSWGYDALRVGIYCPWLTSMRTSSIWALVQIATLE